MCDTAGRVDSTVMMVVDLDYGVFVVVQELDDSEQTFGTYSRQRNNNNNITNDSCIHFLVRLTV